MENNKKLDFNFDFLGEDKDPIEEQEERVEKIINKINKVATNASITTSSQIDFLIEDIGIAIDTIMTKVGVLPEKISEMIVDEEQISSDKINNLSNNSLYDKIFISLKKCSDELNKYKKYVESIALLKFAYNLPKSEENQKKCKECIDNTIKIIAKQNGEKIKTPYHSRFFSSTTSDENNNQNFSDNSENIWDKILLGIVAAIIIAFIAIITLGLMAQFENENVSKLENSSYSYYVKCNNSNITSEQKIYYEKEIQRNFEQIAKIRKVSSKDIEKKLYVEFANRYNADKAAAISKLADTYSYDKTKFNSLKEEYLPIYFKNNIDNLNQAVDAKLGYKELTLIARPLPHAGLLANYTGKQPFAPFQITTGNMHCYIKMYDAQTNELALTIFAPANQTTELKVPLGNYIIKSARGYNWYGVNDLFGHNTVYKRAETIANFHIEGNYVVGKTLQLYETQEGNLHTATINANEF